MLVCHCNAVTEREIRLMLQQGYALDAPIDALAVARHCGAGQGCGGCIRQIVRIVADEQATHTGSDPLLAVG